MKAAYLSIILLLLITSSALAARTTTSQKNAETKLNTNTLGSSNLNPEVTKETAEKPVIAGHKITQSELEALKNIIGVYEEGQNYSQLVDGYGTGMAPPTENEWAEINESLYSIDTVENTDGAPAIAVDNSATPWFPPIGHQGSQGSCVTWSVGYYVKTFQEAKEHGWDLSGASWVGGYYGHPTETYQDKILSPAFIYNLINHGTDGGSSYQAAMNLVCFVGDSSWEKMPYDLSTYTTWPSEAAWTEAALYRGNSSGIQYMSVNTDAGVNNLKNWIASGHLATISVDANKYSALTSIDMWTLDNYNDLDTNHANTIVGYDDSINYTENGETHYGAFKVANSWGVGFKGEKVPDGFYWISYEAMKHRIGYCMFYYDMIGYEPKLLATFEINHEKRSECNIRVGLGTPSDSITTKSFSAYVDGGAVPFPDNGMVLDITEFSDYVPTVYEQSFFLRVYDGGTSTIGEVTRFAVDQEESADAPCQTNSSSPVYLTVTPPLLKQILINTNVRPSVPNQEVAVGAEINLFFTQVNWTDGQIRLYLSTDNLSEVSTGDVAYTPFFDLYDLTASAVTAYSSASGAWQVGYNWVNGTVPTNTAGGECFFKASTNSSVSVLVSDTSVLLTGTLQITPTSGPAETAITVEGYGFSANNTANIAYLNPATATWVSIINDTLTDTHGHFTYGMVAPDLMHDLPAGDNPELFDSIVFRARDNGNGEYYNATSPFNEFRRGLTQVGSAIASGLYGNNTDLTSTVEVLSGDLLTIAGSWFTTEDAVILWDGTYWDSTTVDSNGYFSKTVTVPTAEAGEHILTVENGNTQFTVTVTISSTPSEQDEPPTATPTPSPSPSPTPSPTPSPSPAPTPTPSTPPAQQPAQTPEPQPPEGLHIPPYVIAAAGAFALIGAVLFLLRKRL
jgi:hypothetical protein